MAIIDLYPELPDSDKDQWFFHPENQTLKELLDKAAEQSFPVVGCMGGISIIVNLSLPKDTIFVGSSRANMIKITGVRPLEVKHAHNHRD